MDCVDKENERWIVDRFEGDFAVCERADGFFADWPRALLDGDVGEGDAVRFQDGVGVKDEGETEARKRRIASLMDELF